MKLNQPSHLLFTPFSPWKLLFSQAGITSKLALLFYFKTALYVQCISCTLCACSAVLPDLSPATNHAGHLVTWEKNVDEVFNISLLRGAGGQTLRAFTNFELSGSFSTPIQVLLTACDLVKSPFENIESPRGWEESKA